MNKSPVILAVIFFFASTNVAMAYLDPGIGAIFAQGLIGLIAGFSLFFSKVRAALRRLLGMAKKDSISQQKSESK